MSAKVLWLSHFVPYPPKGGVLQRSYHLIRELASAFDVHLAAFVQPELMAMHYPDEGIGRRESIAALKEMCSQVDYMEIPIARRRGGKMLMAAASLVHPDPYTINWLKSKRAFEFLGRLLSTGKFDIVHFDTISLAPYRQLIPRTTATVLDHHNIESHLLLRRAAQIRNPLKSLYYRQEGLRLKQAERKLAPRFDLHLVCSETDGERLRAHAPEVRMATIPNGVDLSYFEPNRNAIRRRLLFVGTMNWHPNRLAAEFLAQRIWPIVSSAYPDLSIDIVGADPPQAVTDLGKTDTRFKVHGFVDDVRPYFDEAAAFICPIFDGGGTKLKILDALAMRCPVVAHPIATEGIDAKDGVHLITASTPEEYCRSIGRILDEPELRQRLAYNGGLLIREKYSYEQIGDKLRHLFDRLTDKPRCVV